MKFNLRSSSSTLFDFWAIRLTKDTQGRYLFGDPGAPVTSLFGLTPIVTNSIASGTFLVGSGSAAAAEIRDRMGMQVEISTQHSDYFVKNLIAIRAEKRCALVPSGLIRDGHVQPVACLAV